MKSVYLNPYTLDINNIKFNNPVQNTILYNSTFKCILYSTDYMTLNSIKLKFTLRSTDVFRFYQLYKCIYDIRSHENIQILNQLMYIEQSILNKIDADKKPKFMIMDQIKSGFLKFYANKSLLDTKPLDTNNDVAFTLKISGIWESETDYGLTYKLYM